MGGPDHSACLDKAYSAIMTLVRVDQYARYTAYVVVQRQLHVAKLDALWWTRVCTACVDGELECVYRTSGTPYV